jgi:hypothetical protein
MKEYQEIFASAARTATTSATIACKSRAGLFFINITAVTGSPSIVFTISGVDPIAGDTYTILASAAKTGTGKTILRVSENIAASANLIAQDMLPAALKITATHGTADSVTYSMGFIGVGDD